MAGKRVLLIDDDISIVELVKQYLLRDGYNVIIAYEKDKALRSLREGHPDLIVLSLISTGIDGAGIYRTLRTEYDIPVIILATDTTEKTLLKDFKLGTRDYVIKTASPRELAAKVRIVLRRPPENSAENIPEQIQRGKLTVDFLKHEVVLFDKSISLTPVEFSILSVLVKEPARIFKRAELIEIVSIHDHEVSDRTIDAHITNLRRKLETDADSVQYIKTIYGAGYKFGDL